MSSKTQTPIQNLSLQNFPEDTLTNWRLACGSLGVKLSDTVEPRLLQLYNTLGQANQTHNLTRITDPEGFLFRHVLEAWALLQWLPQNARVADVGSGAGFPAFPLAIIRPDLRISAIESVGKKATFIRETAGLLEVSNRLETLSTRSELLSRQPEYRDKFNVVTARAVAALPTLLELCLPLVKPGGLFLALKGPQYAEELTAAKKALPALKAKLQETWHWPTVEGTSAPSNLVILVFKKTAATPALYPRAAGLPSKKPL